MLLYSNFRLRNFSSSYFDEKLKYGEFSNSEVVWSWYTFSFWMDEMETENPVVLGCYIRGQAIDSKMNILRNFGFEDLQEPLIRDRIIHGILSNNFRVKLIGIKNMTLAKCIDICRADEESRKHVQGISTRIVNEYGIDRLAIGNRNVYVEASKKQSWNKTIWR